MTFAVHQRHGTTPFIPKALLSNRNFLLLILLGFVIAFANLAAQVGFPFLFSALHDMSSLDIGLALLPAALATAVVGVLLAALSTRLAPSPRCGSAPR